MKSFLKEVGAFLIRTILFLLLFYFAGLFGGGLPEGMFSNPDNLWMPLLGISIYIPLVLALFYGFGWVCSRFSKSGWSIWLDGFFGIVVIIWGIVTTVTTDISKLMENFLWQLSTGWATPLYSLIGMLTGDDINYYKYVFIAFWVLLAAAIFRGARRRYIPKEKRRMTNICTCSILLALVFAINIPTAINGLKPHMFDETNYPKIDGATAAIPLGQTLARQLLGKDYIEAQKYVSFNTTHDAYVNLIEGKADIIFAAEPSDEEIELAKNNGVELKLTPIGMDAFVFIVNKQNPVDGLTVEQIRQIYSGQITNWKDIDGATDREIIAYQRPKNSGSQTLMENIVMKGLTMMDAPTDRRPGGMGGMMDVVADYKNAENSLGYTVYYYASQMNRKESVNFLAVDGVPCNKETIRAGTYPFAGALYAVTRHGDENESTQKLLNYLLSTDGQELVEKGGFVSVDVANVPERTRVIRYPENEFGAMINYIKNELHGNVIEFGHKIVDTNGDFIENTVEAEFVNGHADTLHTSVTNEFSYDANLANRPVQLTFEIEGKQAVYQDLWNDGVQVYIFAFTRNDQYMNIVVTSSGTGAGDHHTTIYRYDGERIFKFAEFPHYVKELYSDSSGKIYFVQMQFEGDLVTAPAVMSLDSVTGELNTVK